MEGLGRRAFGSKSLSFRHDRFESAITSQRVEPRGYIVYRG